MKNLINNMLLLWLCAIVSHTAQAQGTVVWEKKPIAKIARRQGLRTAVESRDKQFWVGIGETSMTSPNGSGSNAASVMAFDAATGDSLWYKHFFQYPIRSNPWGIAPAPNGHFWVVMEFIWDMPNVPPYESAGIAVFEIDSLGNILQQKEFMQGCQIFSSFSVYPQPDGGVLIVGDVVYGTSTCNDRDLFAMRLNGQGNQLWQVTYTMPYDQSILSAGLYPGNKLCIGYHDDVSTNYSNRMLFIDTESGILLYKKNTPSGAGRFWLRCYPLRDGSFILGGVASSNTLINNAYIARTDANFNILWERVDYTAVSYSAHMIETKDSCIVTRATAIAVPDNRQFMSKINFHTGQELWRRDCTGSLVVAHDDDVYAVGAIEIFNVTRGDDFYAARYTNVADFLQPSDYCSDSLRANFTGTWLQDTLRLRSTSHSGMVYQDSLDYQWFIGGATVSIDSTLQQTVSMQANPEGVTITLVITNFWGCKDTLEARILPNGTITGVDTHGSVYQSNNTHNRAYLRNAYPNPSTQNVTIGYTLPAKTENAVLRVYEMATGRTVAERHLSDNAQETRFNVSGWATGVYAYQLYVEGVPVAVKKMTVSR